MIKNFFKNQHGFSLIETLIAVSILMIAIAGPLALVQAGLFSSIHERNQITATYLAQEALEYIKNFRDTNSYTQYLVPPETANNWLAGPSGVGFLSDTAGDGLCDGSGCYVDPHGYLDSSTFIQHVTPVNKYLYQNTNTGSGVFSYSYNTAGTPTPFQRIVKITRVSDDEVTVSVIMNWNDNAINRTYIVNENIYNYEQ